MFYCVLSPYYQSNIRTMSFNIWSLHFKKVDINYSHTRHILMPSSLTPQELVYSPLSKTLHDCKQGRGRVVVDSWLLRLLARGSSAVLIVSEGFCQEVLPEGSARGFCQRVLPEGSQRVLPGSSAREFCQRICQSVCQRVCWRVC